MYADSDKRRSYQRKWDAANRPQRERAAAQADWKSRQDPNLRREREAEQRFRWRGARVDTDYTVITNTLEATRPTFLVVDRNGVLQQEKWETPEQLIVRLRKKGALMVPDKPKKPRQSTISPIDAATAREILAGSGLDHGKEADRHESEISIAVQMMLLHSHKHAHPEVEPAVARLSALRQEQQALVDKLQALAEADLEEHGYAYVLDEK